MKSIIEQCKELYQEAFDDDVEFTELLFNTFFESSCRFLSENGKIVSMLFAIDVTLDSHKGKYIYAVATDKNMRGKGYMRILFNKIIDEFRDKYDFLCLKPMSENLFAFYEKLGFERKFTKAKVVNGFSNSDTELTLLSDINTIKSIRKTLIKNNYVEYSDDFYKLILSYCNVYCDNVNNSTVFIVVEKTSQKVKEVLGNYKKLPSIFNNKELLINGTEFDYAMIKYLTDYKFGGYLGYALD